MAKGSFGGGQGTKESPYEIEDLWDYLAMSSKTESENYFKLTADINMNDYEDYKFEIPSVLFRNNISTRKYFLDGDNHSIKNIIMKDTIKPIFKEYNYNAGEIKNIKFENLIFININDSTPLFICESSKNIHIGCYVFDSICGPIFPESRNFHDCTFNIKGKYRDNSYCSLSSYNGSVNMERVRINFDLFLNNGDNSFINGSSPSYFTADNCYFTGKIKINKTTANTYYIFTGIDLKNSYYNVDLVIPNRMTDIALYNCYNTTFSFANQNKIKHLEDKEEISGISFSSVNNFSFLTDEECKDPQGLLERGFPVVPSDT